MANWIFEEDQKKPENFVLTKPQKYSVLKTYHASKDFTKEQKDKLREVVMKGDNSDEGHQVIRSCELILPDADLKAKLWKEITDPNTTEPQKDL